MWIERDISIFIQKNLDPIQILRGPRQCGKTSLFLQLDPSFKELSLDDPGLRDLAQSDPELFLSQYGSENLFIDEAQYAPNLFPSLKRKVDLYKRNHRGSAKTILRLTGSNQIMMDKNIKESLAGRASFFDLNTLSIAEILASKPKQIQDILYMGGWPELHRDSDRDPKKYLDDYINSYIEKDVVLAAGIQKGREFLTFIRLLAGRVGEILDLTSLGNDVGVDAKTAKEWISVLQKMNIVVLVPPFATNLSKRLIKSPKVFFIDTGLACRLQGWTSAQPIMTSPQQGHLFENLVFSEVFKTIQNFQLGWNISHWRSKEGEEIDFIIEKGPGKFLFIEAKVSPTSTKNVSQFAEVKKVFRENTPVLIQCHQEGTGPIANKIPIAFLKHCLLKDDF